VEREYNGNLYLPENVYSPEDPNFKDLDETEPVFGGRNFGPLPFHYRQVSLY
jgi:hypothetical protein